MEELLHSYEATMHNLIPPPPANGKFIAAATATGKKTDVQVLTKNLVLREWTNHSNRYFRGVVPFPCHLSVHFQEFQGFHACFGECVHCLCHCVALCNPEDFMLSCSREFPLFLFFSFREQDHGPDEAAGSAPAGMIMARDGTIRDTNRYVKLMRIAYILHTSGLIRG